MCVKRFYLFAVLSGLAASGVLQVNGIKVYMSSSDVEAVNGTNVRLKCTFTSTSPIHPAALTISWSFRPLQPGREESVFYYHDKPYPPPEGRFRKRVEWAGDIMGRDASIVLREVKFTYNGTYVCQVKNPPDVHGNAGEVHLHVVTTASFSEIAILAASIGGAVVVLVIVLITVVSVKRCRKERPEGLEEVPGGERKDPTVCDPARAVHLYMPEKEYEIDSSDGMISDASTKDPSSSEDEEQDSDDAGGDDSD
ncbi:myelin protein zero-like protein 2 [Osmerus eperlanus]|uniref:myelin protein zero-like protein 2 n=1 Tax=Osmerus eperlanus TaxID=29151 RepID=UPI002E131373